jgi:hypothetical protein
MSTRNVPGGKGRPAHKADNITAICQPIVYKMQEPRRLTNPMGLHGMLQIEFYLLNIVGHKNKIRRRKQEFHIQIFLHPSWQSELRNIELYLIYIAKKLTLFT